MLSVVYNINNLSITKWYTHPRGFGALDFEMGGGVRSAEPWV